MSSPKEKAEQLINQYMQLKFAGPINHLLMHEAIMCALIAVDEILKSNPLEPTYKYNDGEVKYELNSQDYWEQVKTEIEKL